MGDIQGPILKKTHTNQITRVVGGINSIATGLIQLQQLHDHIFEHHEAEDLFTENLIHYIGPEHMHLVLRWNSENYNQQYVLAHSLNRGTDKASQLWKEHKIPI